MSITEQETRLKLHEEEGEEEEDDDDHDNDDDEIRSKGQLSTHSWSCSFKITFSAYLNFQ